MTISTMSIGAREGPFAVQPADLSALEALACASSDGRLAILTGTLRNERAVFLGVYRRKSRKRAASFFPIAVLLREKDLEAARDCDLSPLPRELALVSFGKRGKKA